MFHRLALPALRNLSQVRAARLPWFIGLLLICIHGLTWLAGWSPAVAGPWLKWGLSRDGLLDGAWWSLFTYPWLHGTWAHVVLNSLFIIVVGARIEHMLGWRATAWACGTGAVAGGLVHLLAGNGVLIGFSGGALALWMLLVSLSPQSRMLPFPGPCIWLGWGVLLASLAMVLIDPSMKVPALGSAGEWLVNRGYGAVFRIGHACHLGGGLAGWVMARWILRPTVTLDQLKRQRARQEARRADAGDQRD